MATVDQTMLRVQRLLTGPMNFRIQLSGDIISVRFEGASTLVNLRVLDFGKSKDGEPRTLVRVSAPVVRGVTPTPELYEYLAREAPRSWFGNLAVDEDKSTPGTVGLAFGHTLLGDFLDEAELAVVLNQVLSMADSLDDPIQKRFGGKRAVD